MIGTVRIWKVAKEMITYRGRSEENYGKDSHKC